MRWMVTGATGFLGRAIVARLRQPVLLGRDMMMAKARFPGLEVHSWDPEKGLPAQESFKDVETIVHLAGEPVAAKRWSSEQKRRIRDSRILGTRNLVAALGELPVRPKVLLSASAVGYYGDQGDDVLDENTPKGDGFLAEVCEAWEQEALLAESLGIRVVCIRCGVVLGNGGGALAKMLTAFRSGLGGRLGTGDQWMPWVAIEDVAGIFWFAAEHPELRGPINAVSPAPVTNREFTKALGQALHRPVLLPVPGLALRLAFGEMSQMLLASQRVVPALVLRYGYTFQEPGLQAYLKRILTTGNLGK
jgi:uncharacterized protein (TIGR01777 family)